MSMRICCALTIAASVLVVSSARAADDPGPGTATATASTPTATASVTTTSAAAAPAAATTKETVSDHEKFVGHLAVGYFGISQLPIGSLAPGGGGAFGIVRNNVNAPVIGARYWLSQSLGIDAGIGFALVGGSSEVVNGGTATSTDKPSALGFALHAGVPIAFAYGKHYTFELVPETTVGFTSGTIKSGAAGQPDTSLSGFKLDVGARVGAELHFGFIGVPELALQGTIGLYVRRETFKVKVDPNSASDGTTTIATTVGSDPWALFTNSISALYYF